MRHTFAALAIASTLAAWGCSSDGDPGSADEFDQGSGTEPGSGNGGTDQGGGVEPGSGVPGGEAGASAGGSGGESAEVGGAPPEFVPGELTYGVGGYFPTTVTKDDAQGAYESWRGGYVEDCGATLGKRVRGPKPDVETLAEGVGFGALMSVAWDDRPTFDGLWTYYQNAAKAADQKRGVVHGMMGWLASGNACALDNVEPGSPSGASLDMAMALLQAACRWEDSTYFDAAFKLVGSIKKYMTQETASGLVLLPDDDNNAACMNPSYFSPAYYRVFARAFPAQASFWQRMADDSYAFLEQATNSTTGLAPDWAATGTATCSSATNFVGYDGMRTLWRTQTDYAWFETAAAKSWLDRVTNWAETAIGAEKLANVREGFFVDGSDLFGEEGQANSAFVGALAVGAMATDQDVTDDYHGAYLAVPAANDAGYYQATARALYMVLSVNQFSSGCFAEP